MDTHAHRGQFSLAASALTRGAAVQAGSRTSPRVKRTAAAAYLGSRAGGDAAKGERSNESPSCSAGAGVSSKEHEVTRYGGWPASSS